MHTALSSKNFAKTEMAIAYRRATQKAECECSEVEIEKSNPIIDFCERKDRTIDFTRKRECGTGINLWRLSHEEVGYETQSQA